MLRTTATVLQTIRLDCDRRRPLEACGLLLGSMNGSDVSIVRSVPTENVWPVPAERATRFAIDPLTQMRAEQAAAAEGLDLVGFYHSHPRAPAVPSGFDLGRAWPKYVYLIIGYDDPTNDPANDPTNDPGAPTPRAWGLDAGGRFVEHRMLIEEHT